MFFFIFKSPGLIQLMGFGLAFEWGGWGLIIDWKTLLRNELKRNKLETNIQQQQKRFSISLGGDSPIKKTGVLVGNF